MIIKITAILLALLAVGYLIWWWRRFSATLRARRLAASARQENWSPSLVEDLLEYTRLLGPLSPDFEWVCLELAKRKVNDPRARALFELYLTEHDLTRDNTEVARRFVHLTSPEPVDPLRTTEVSNAASLLDRLAQTESLAEEDVRQRATYARLWIEVSPPAIGACIKAWHSAQGAPEAEPLMHFLHDYFSATWENRRDLAEQYGNDFVADAADVFCAMGAIPPVNPAVRRRAIEATFERHDYTACFNQCRRAHEEFRASTLDDHFWRMWGECIVQLEGSDWDAFGRRQFAHLPSNVSWALLREVLDRAAALHPESNDLLSAQAWAYLGLGERIDRALPIYERVLARRLPIVPVLELLARYYHQEQAWAKLQGACRMLLPLLTDQRTQLITRWLAQALIEGNLEPDISVFERVFDNDQTYLTLNECLARHYLAMPSFSQRDLSRVERVLASVLPPSFTKDDLQSLREKFALAWLNGGVMVPEPLSAHIDHYLEGGGANSHLLQWAADMHVGSDSHQLAALEALARQRPVERRNCLALAKRYQSGASDQQLELLADAVESDWKTRARFDGDDCNLALFIGQRVSLSSEARRKLLMTLMQDHPTGWAEASAHYLAETLQQSQADTGLLQLALNQLYKPDALDPLHVWVLEAMGEMRNEPNEDGLRLLALYDAGVARPGENDRVAHSKGAALAEKLAGCCGKLKGTLRSELFAALARRIMNNQVTAIANWEIDLWEFGLRENLVPTEPECLQFAEKLAGLLAARGEKSAVNVQRWAYEHGMQRPADAARLFELAHRLDLAVVGDTFWFQVARLAISQADVSADASSFMVDNLLAKQQWDEDDIEISLDLLEPPYRQRLASAFVERVPYGRARELDRALVDFIDDTPELGCGRVELLLALMERREKRRRADGRLDVDGALEAGFLIEKSVGSSKDLTCRILTLLADSLNPQRYADKLADYLGQYHDSLDVLTKMVMLAYHPARPLGFDLAFEIVVRWGELAIQSDTGCDPELVATTKCKVYDLYYAHMTPQNAQAMLGSISKHSSPALSDEVRRCIERIGDQVMSSSGQDYQARRLVAESLHSLGNLPAAISHFEQLAQMPDCRQTAIEHLQDIVRQLESSRRELPALLTAYRCIAEDAYRAGRTEEAEATLKKAKVILSDSATLEKLAEEDRKRVDSQRVVILTLYQTVLESRAKSSLAIDQIHDLADVYRLCELWDKAGDLYFDLAKVLNQNKRRAEALENAGRMLDAYLKADKSLWDPAARSLLRFLTGHAGLPSEEEVNRFDVREVRLTETVAVLYHSLSVDPNLQLDSSDRNRYKHNARELYNRLPLEYRREHEYISRLERDLRQPMPAILEPFDCVQHVRE